MGLSRADGGVLQVAVSGVFLQTTASEILDGKGGVTGARWRSAAAIGAMNGSSALSFDHRKSKPAPG
jgi:hypothetical protein